MRKKFSDLILCHLPSLILNVNKMHTTVHAPWFLRSSVLFTSLNRQEDLLAFKDALAAFCCSVAVPSGICNDQRTRGKSFFNFFLKEGLDELNGKLWIVMDWNFLVEHNVGSIEQALMVVKSPQNTECYKERWFLAMWSFPSVTKLQEDSFY